MVSKTKTVLKLSAIITKEGNEYVALCPELDTASQGSSIENALEMLKEAIELYLEDEDVKELPKKHAFITSFEV
ncbi:MAG: type II toxin-antitoxin system HicB family antitoxin [Candidatus Diapherotrites archaeon]|nr:type II toxin-antitoxin system HicB family antitoxin [Candidatus Diapherotrites archaeon]